LTVELDKLSVLGAGAAEAAGDARDAIDRWQRSVTRAARKLEAAWIELERRAYRELDEWAHIAARVAQWRRPLWPVLAAGIVGVAVAIWLGLVFGGYVPPPAWLANAWSGVFGR